MSGAGPPSLPRLSPIGWSIDEASDLHSAVFDIANGSDASHSGSGTQRGPLREWPEPGRTVNRSATSSKSYAIPQSVGSPADLEHKPYTAGDSRAHGPTSAPIERSFVGRQADSVAASPSSTTPHESEQILSRSNSIFKLKPNFRRKRSVDPDPEQHQWRRPSGSGSSAGDARPVTAPSSAGSSSSSRAFGGLKDLMLTSSRKSATSSRVESGASEGGRASSDIDNPMGASRSTGGRSSTSLGAAAIKEEHEQMDNTVVIVTNQHDRHHRLSELSKHMRFETVDDNRQQIPTLALPNSPSQGFASGSNDPDSVTASTASHSMRRRREHPPPLQAPTLPLPPPPATIGQRGDPADEVEDLLYVPQSATSSRSASQSTVDRFSEGKRSVRKSKSQSSLRLLRKRSNLSSLMKKEPTEAARKTSAASTSAATRAYKAGAPWEIMAGSRLELSDSSPETERLSLPYSDDVRDGSSSPSLEEARRALSPAMDGISTHTSSLGLPSGSSRPSSSQGRSRLDSSGGASGLFGTSAGNGRQRASSLLPWRSRANSHAHVENASSPFVKRPSAEAPAQRKTHEIDAGAFGNDADAFVRHVVSAVSRTDVPAILAASGDDIHKDGLRIYMQRFLFAGHPLDVALRKLLMSLCLPKETQQIDRVMEAFARRYNECNENLFVSDDQPYMLAFSLMMLHTDTFNRNAKQKMSKADYVRNTAASGVAPEILEYLYDNLTFTQFIYVEDDDFLQRRKIGNDLSSFRSAFSAAGGAGKGRVDPYHIIASGQTHTMRPEIHIDEDSPFSATGTKAEFDIEALLKAFVNAPSIEIITARKASLPSTGLGGVYAALPYVSKEEESIVTLRISKVGCISRKDDLIEDNKKAQSRKWKTCGMILSSSQLLFFRDLVWTSALDQRIVEQTKEQPDKQGGIIITPRISYFKPDGVLALGDAVAVRDTTYSKYKHVFRLVARQGDMNRQYLIQTGSEAEMNDWIHKINFCSAFRSAGLRIRGLDVSVDGNSSPISPLSPTAKAISTDQSAPSSPPTSPSAASVSSSQTSVPRVGLLRRKLNARLREFTPIIEKVSASLDEYQAVLEEKLRLARHLAIATPFTKTTRERLEALAGPLAVEIRQLRLEVARQSCRKELLLLELEAGNRAAKASAPSTAFDEILDSNESYSWSPHTAGMSPLSLTPREGSHPGSLSTSRASSFSQGRAGSISAAPELAVPMPKLPRPAIPVVKARMDETGMTTPIQKPIPLYEMDIRTDDDRTQGKNWTGSPRGDEASTAVLDGDTIGRNGSIGLLHSFTLASPSEPLPDEGQGASRAATSARPNGSGDGGHGGGSVPSSPRETNRRTSSRFHLGSSPTRLPREEPIERWDRTKMGRDADKRVSLVNLPDPQQWQTLTPKLAMNAGLREPSEESGLERG